MIFAEMEYLEDHWGFHEELKEFLHGHFRVSNRASRATLGFGFLMANRK
ncbi:hypothetical protein HDE80_004317 [Rhodanobacter sp. A1T4]|nr:hypothetical protein [Rhodanobacter sp. A1T4]